jgi:hypothetical protein
MITNVNYTPHSGYLMTMRDIRMYLRRSVRDMKAGEKRVVKINNPRSWKTTIKVTELENKDKKGRPIKKRKMTREQHNLTPRIATALGELQSSGYDIDIVWHDKKDPEIGSIYLGVNIVCRRK